MPLLVIVTILAFITPRLDAQMSVSLSPSVASPSTVGTVISWTADVSSTKPGTLWYRFRVRGLGPNFRVVKDYGPDNTLDWTATDHDGLYEVEVSVRNRGTGDSAVASSSYQMLSNVSEDQPVITPTSHPLVFLYSAPPCEPGNRMKVQFQSPDGVVQQTPYKSCRAGMSMNFYLAGLQANTQYSVQHTIDTGSAFQQGRTLTFGPGDARSDLAAQTVLQPPQSNLPSGILLQGTLFKNTLATDLNGNLIWYYPGNISYITRPEAGGYFFGIVQNNAGDQSRQILRAFDLVGTTVLETNAARVSEQLVAMGKRPISSFHHEARRLADGRILVLAAVEQILRDVQGTGDVDVLGDMIVVLNSDLQVEWAWDTFDHLDVRRQATLGDVCLPGECPPFYLATEVSDWVHGNSVQQTPDGNLLYSSRSQDWVIKIDYSNGNGGGDVIWRLGKDGDFQFNSTDPYPWFSHQHDPQFVPGEDSTITLLDNGNVRNAADPSANSRGQVIQLDERNRVANLILNADLGQYSFALGSASKLPNGNYHFDVGFLNDATSTAIEVDASGKTVYALHAAAPDYRSFRMRDMYTP